MKYVYLAGSIADDPDPRSWRVRCAEILPAGWEALDPLKIECKHMTDAEIVALDYGLILKASAVIVNVGMASWGTAMELAFAKQYGVPAIGFCELRQYSGSRWLRHHIYEGCVYSRMCDAVNTLHEVPT